MKKVLVYDKLIPLHKEFLKNFNSFALDSKEITNSKLIKLNCEILLTRSTVRINSELLNEVNILYYATATAGYDHIDLDYLMKKGIKYFISEGCNSNSVAEYVMINILNYLISIRASPLLNRIGIIGYGNIGKKVAYYSKLLGLNVIINDPPLKDAGYKLPENYEYSELDSLLRKSDIVTNHIPLILDGDKKTENLLSKNINKIKRNSLFIHSSRGGIVNENDLIAFQLKKNFTLAIDVWENEPKINKKLLHNTTLATPHIAGHSYNAKINASNMIMNDLYVNNYVENLFKFNLFENQITTKDNIFFQLIEANKIREFEKDSKLLKKNSLLFQNIRKKYPKKYEVLNIKSSDE